MTNTEKISKLFQIIDAKTKTAILNNIAKNYGITVEAARLELLNTEAESLLDYMTGPERAATHILMKRHGLTF